MTYYSKIYVAMVPLFNTYLIKTVMLIGDL